jgi:hypothetical protein
VPAEFGDGPVGASGVTPPPLPAGAGVELSLLAARTASVAETGGTAVGPSAEMMGTDWFGTVFPDVRANARSPAATEDGAWSSTDGDAGVVTSSPSVVLGAAAAIGGAPGPAALCVAPTVEAGSVVVGAGGTPDGAGGAGSLRRVAGTAVGAGRAVGAGAAGGVGVASGGGAAPTMGAPSTVRAGVRAVLGAGAG